MKIRYILLILLCVTSFYVSDKLILYVESLSPLMKQIKSVSATLEEEPIDAIIDGNNIITGINGKKPLIRESYLKMNEFGVFNENFFVYDYIKPKVSISDNLDKYIVGSNRLDYVAIIIDDFKFKSILDDYEYTYIIKDIDNYIDKKNIEYIIGSNDNYKELESFFKKKKIKNDKVIVDYMNGIDTKNKYIINPSIQVYHSNLASAINKISGGEIIYIHDDLSISELKVFLSKIKYKNLSVMQLSKFISE